MNPRKPIYLIHHIPKTGGVSIRNWLVQHLGMHQGMIHHGVMGELFCMEHQLPFLEQMTVEQRRGLRVVIGHYVKETTADLFPDREILRLIVLRDPVKRLISQYNHAMTFWCEGMRRPRIDFYEWFEHYVIKTYDYKDAIRRQGLTPELAFQSQASLGPNYMARFIAQNFDKVEWLSLEPAAFASKISSLLENFWQVGLTERLDIFVAKLAEELGIPANLPHSNRGSGRRIYLEPDEELIAFIRQRNRADFLIYDHWKKKVSTGGE